MTLKANRAELAAQIAAAVASLGGVSVLPYDPPVVSGDAVTVSTAGLNATEHPLFVRVYVDAVQSEQGQDRLDDIAEAVDAGISTPRSDWEFAYDESKDCFVMVTTVDYPREDWG